MECGHSLQEPKKTPDYSEPQSYTPKFLADKILTSRSSIEGERKLVTVLFADVANYTALSEKLDPEEVHQIMDGCFKILMDEIHRYEGTINQFTGDGVMALFGAPISHEDHAQRACHAALAVQEAMQSYGEKIKLDCMVDFAMRIGLNSGHVIVGSIGDNLRMDYTAVGDITNLAARLESHATPGTVLISKNTYKMAQEYFEFKSMGEIEVKGKDTPQEAYEIIKISKVETRLDASAAKGLTKFVGRKNSMALLQAALEKVRSGSGQVIGIVGEAGVGKSRLILEFQNRLPAEEYRFLECRCLHFGGSMIYLPFLNIIKTYFDISDDDREFIIKKKIRDKALGFEQPLTKAIPAIHDLLSLQIDDEIYSKLDPQSKRERTFEAIRDIFLFESHKKPLILIIEDSHWIDKTSEDVINYLIGWLANSQIMLILLYRPEYTHQWGSKSYYTKIGLDQLSTESSSQLLEAIFKGDVVPELRELILNRAAGNPLFMEELTHSLIENGSVKQENNQYILRFTNKNTQIPETIQGIIAARMDRLEDNLKRTMQVASVIGRDFAFRILNTITGMREDLKSYLLNLQGLEFIYEKRLFPELEYIFKHALTQEVAYNSLLKNRRKEIHEQIGRAIERIYADRIEEFYEMLAYHYYKSDSFEISAKYLKLAARKARIRGSYMEAISFSKRHVSCLEMLPKNEKILKQLVDARTTLSVYFLNLNYHADAMEAIEPIIDLATKTDYRNWLPIILTASGCYQVMTLENLPKGIEELKKAIIVSKEIGDMLSLWVGNHFLGLALSSESEFESGAKHFTNALNLSLSDNNKFGISISKGSLALFTAGHGKIDLAFKISQELSSLLEDDRDIYTRGIVRGGYGCICYYKGMFDESENALLEAVELCEKTSHISIGAWSALHLGNVYFEKGKYDKAISYYTKVISLLKQGRIMPSWIGIAQIEIMRTRCFQNIVDMNLNNLFNYAYENKVKIFDGMISRLIGTILMRTDDQPQSLAEDLITKAIDIDEKRELRWQLAKDYAAYSDFFKKNGNIVKAKENMVKAIDIFKACGADGWGKKYEKELTAL
ncbi:MAG: adenylate/guanylate cyclase domain-containing protein [Desulfobacterales bacterium]